MLKNMDYDTNFFSCIWTKERLYLLIQFQHDNFHIDQCIIKQMKRLKTFANWTPFVPWLNFFYHSHVIIQAFNTNSFQHHYQDIDHNHNLQVLSWSEPTTTNAPIEDEAIQTILRMDQKPIFFPYPRIFQPPSLPQNFPLLPTSPSFFVHSISRAH